MAELTRMFVADVCAKPGRQPAAAMIKPLREEFGVDYCIANVENAAGGFGVTPEMSSQAFKCGIDTQTSGNHIWDRYELNRFLAKTPNLIRPANYPDGAPGNGFYIDDLDGIRIGVVNLMGRTFMKDIDCPFKKADCIIEEIRKVTPIIFLDFHAEVTAEKQAMLYYLDGRVSAIVGTHTHIPTADEHVTEKGTAFICDAGMTGPYDSIIGMHKEPSLKRFLTGLPHRMTPAENDVRIAGVIVKIDSETGKAISIERYSRSLAECSSNKHSDSAGKE